MLFWTTVQSAPSYCLLPLRYLGLDGAAEKLDQRTVRQETETMKGRTVTLTIAAASTPEIRYTIEGAFTSDRLFLVEQTYPY